MIFNIEDFHNELDTSSIDSSDFTMADEIVSDENSTILPSLDFQKNDLKNKS